MSETRASTGPLEDAIRHALKVANGQRQTGRTTRMLDEAKAAATSGKRVLVIAANAREQERLTRLTADAPGITVIHRDGRPLMGNRNGVEWDHFAVECEINDALFRLCRFGGRE